MAYNKVIFEGNLGGDVTMAFTPEGKAVAKFNVAVNDGYGKDKNVIWINVRAWEATAEACNSILHKGSRVLVEGHLRTPGAWINKDDNLPRASIEVTANTVVFLDKKE
jgi:single-strand DNA-binding protein